MPFSKVYRRGKPDEKFQEKREEKGSNLYDNKREKERENPNFKRYEDLLSIHWKLEDPNAIKLEERYQDKLPPEAKDL